MITQRNPGSKNRSDVITEMNKKEKEKRGGREERKEAESEGEEQGGKKDIYKGWKTKNDRGRGGRRTGSRGGGEDEETHTLTDG